MRIMRSLDHSIMNFVRRGLGSLASALLSKRERPSASPPDFGRSDGRTAPQANTPVQANERAANSTRVEGATPATAQANASLGSEARERAVTSSHADERTIRRMAEAQQGGKSSEESRLAYERGDNPGGLHHHHKG